MQLYAGNSKDFIADATRNGIAIKLENAFLDAFHYKPSPQEVRSWRDSLREMAHVLKDGHFLDHGILLEYQLPLSSKRLDCMVTGENAGGQANSVIVELKQWDQVEASNADDCVVTWVANRKRDILHPSRQVGQYEEYLRDMHAVFSQGKVGVRSCAYLHNLVYDPANEIYGDKHAALLKLYPAYAGDQRDELTKYLAGHLGAGKGGKVLDEVLASKFSPSKKLLEYTGRVVEDQKAYVLLDSQQVVFAKVLAEVREATKATKRKKTVVVVHGGPGTGKSVIALHLLGRLSGENKQVLHLTGSKTFTENMRGVVGRRAGALFKYFNVNRKGEIPANQFDALVLDEAHRIRDSSRDRFMRTEDWSGLPQIEELISIAKVSVFFIDDRQIVRPGEVGSSELIRAAAEKAGAHLLDFELDAQFRCSGSDGFVNWIDNTLGVQRTANVLWKREDPYEFKVADTVQELEEMIRAKAATGATARLVAGFCWPWSKPQEGGTLVSDVKVGDWQMPWNAKPDAGNLAAGIPTANFWPSDPGGLEQVGCVYTAQGFEFDYVGIIFGLDLRYDWEVNAWVGDKTKSHDRMVRPSPQFIELVKNTYRVLLTRGIKGCYVHFMDEGTERFFKSRLE
jgi:DUF2075 family protein